MTDMTVDFSRILFNNSDDIVTNRKAFKKALSSYIRGNVDDTTVTYNKDDDNEVAEFVVKKKKDQSKYIRIKIVMDKNWEHTIKVIQPNGTVNTTSSKNLIDSCNIVFAYVL